MGERNRMSGYILEKSKIENGDMEKINQFTRRKFAESEIYTFSLVLCDNEIDRDYDRFSLRALRQLQTLFVGKTCIFDHERKSANQTARIFDTKIQTQERQMPWGERYTQLIAKAYLPMTDKTQDLITAIESGILKEVSVSCAVSESRCNLCGKNNCMHQKGKKYKGEICHQIFEGISDAYECSFVAVPAQRAAGVVKHFAGQEVKQVKDILKNIYEREEMSMDAEQVNQLAECWQSI